MRLLLAGLAIVLLGLVVRLVHLLESRSVLFFHHPISDGRAYLQWARRILSGDWLGSEVFYQAPLYPYFLATVQWLGGQDLFLVRLVQVILGSLACGLIFLAGRNLFGISAGVAAGTVLALYAPAIFFDGLIQKAVLDTFLFALLLWIVSQPTWPGHIAWVLASGATLGLFALSRENALILAPVLLAAILLNRRTHLGRRTINAAVFAAGLSLILLPVGIRNKQVGGEFALTTSQAGTNFFIGNNPHSQGMYTPLRRGREDPMYERADAVALAEQAMGRSLTPSEVSRYWFGRGVEYIRTDFSGWARLMGRKTLLTVNAYEVPDAEDIYFYERSCRLIRWLGRFTHFGVLLPLAVLGVALVRPRHATPWVFVTMAGVWLVGVVVFYVMARYRFPVVPVLALLAGAGVIELARCLRGTQWRRLTGPALAAGVAAVIANWPLLEKDAFLAQSLLNSAAAHLDRGEHEQAVEAARASLSIRPDLPVARFVLGVSLSRLEHTDEAIEQLLRASRDDPTDAKAAAELGFAFATAGRWTDAAAALERAYALDPTLTGVRSNLIVASLAMENWSRAMVLLREEVEASADNTAAAMELIWLLAACPDPAQRSPEEAMRRVSEMRERLGDSDPELLDVAAAAYASAGRFDLAAATARAAIESATRQRRHDLGLLITGQLARYERRQPPVYAR